MVEPALGSGLAPNPTSMSHRALVLCGMGTQPTSALQDLRNETLGTLGLASKVRFYSHESAVKK